PTRNSERRERNRCNHLGIDLIPGGMWGCVKTGFIPHLVLSWQARVKDLEDQCRSQTEQFSLLSQELQQFRLQTGKIDLLTSTLVTSELPLALCSSAPQPHWEKGNCWTCLRGRDHGGVGPPRLSPRLRQRRKGGSSPASLPAPRAACRQPGSTRSFSNCKYFSYNPFDGPNENPEAELPLTAGEYIYIYGEMDEDGFFEGELMDGRRGLVPSNFVERVSDDDLMMFLPPELNDLTHSSYQEKSLVSASTSSGDKSELSIEEGSISPLASREGDQEEPVSHTSVPYPRRLTLIKQLARSIVVGWEPPLLPAGCPDIQSYNIYVDEELRQNVKSGLQTKAVIEKLDLHRRAYRVSVQTVTEHGRSDKLRCTFFVGQDFGMAPTMLKVISVTATSAEVTWLPCNSNYSHGVYLNGQECDVTKPGVYWYTFHNLQPSTQYVAKLEARPMKSPWEEAPKGQEGNCVWSLTGTPDAPLDVQVEAGPSPGILVISWLPVTIDAEGSSNGVRVTGYAVYADGQKVIEVTSPTAGSVLVDLSQLQMFQVCHEVSVRTMSQYGESVDSVPAQISSVLLQSSHCTSPVCTAVPFRLPRGSTRASLPAHSPQHTSALLIQQKIPAEKRWATGEMEAPGNGWGEAGRQCQGRAHVLSAMFPLCSGPPRSTAPESSGKDDGIRIFVALFDYDPVSMSPNPDAAEEELPFKEGQILKVRTYCVRVGQVGDQGKVLPAEGAGHCPGSPGNGHSPEAARAPRVFGQGGVVGVSMQGTGAGLNDPCRSLPTQDIPWFFLCVAQSLQLKHCFSLQVCGDKDADGFYRGECAGREGYIPCNMVSEVPVESSELKHWEEKTQINKKTQEKKEQFNLFLFPWRETQYPALTDL
uniref:TSPO associated protein 1 n=1 Tax=Catharus ustulatus TaxID=91951 RepID=A0A8C3Y5H9_CATUS